MPDFKTINDYELYIRDLSYADLKGIERKIDKDKFPDRYDLVCKLIKNKEIVGDTKAEIEKKYHPPGVVLIRNVHFAIVLLGGIGFIIKLFSRSGIANAVDIIYKTQGLLFSGIIVYGIYYIRPWVVLLIIIYAYIAFVGRFIDLLYYTRSNIVETDMMIIKMAFILFMFYQIFIFSKNSTKIYFKARNNVIL